MNYILVFNKNNAPEVPYFVVSAQSTNVNDLMNLAQHHDHIIGYLPKARWTATAHGTVTVSNVATGQQDRGTVYHVQQR